MSDTQISNISSILQDNLLLKSFSKESLENDRWQKFQDELKTFPSVLNKETITKLTQGEYNVSLREYTSMNTYTTMMNSLYGNNSADKFRNLLNNLTNSTGVEVNTAKNFIDKMRENGMTNKTAVKTFIALQKYSLMSSANNYNFVNARA